MAGEEHLEPPAQPPKSPRHRLLPLLKVRVWISDHIRPSELQETLFWAGIVGFAGGASSVLFRRLTGFVHWLLTQQSGSMLENFGQLPMWQRFVTPAIGGALAGLPIYFGMRHSRGKSSTDYMEAIALGDGVISFRQTLVKCASALFTIASGGSIGREGPLVQLSSMLASLVGRWQKAPPPRRRLIVACGAAAGIASAYNAPIAGALFIAEIVLRSVAMESFGPLVFSSVVATLTVRQLMGAEPLYEIPPFQLNSNWEVPPYLALGLLAGVVAPLFLRLLRLSEKLFAGSKIPVVLRLPLGGLIVGALAISHPQVCGNGYSVVASILHGQWLWQSLVLILVFKMIATSATFGSGAVGGVFTPTLFCGAGLGYLFGYTMHGMWPSLNPSAFALVGMGAFLAATTHAPIMAMLMVSELTLDYQIILPLMLTCVVAYYTSVSIEKRSIYSESLRRKGADDFEKTLANMRVVDLMKTDPATVSPTAGFAEIAQSFITHRYNYLYVMDELKNFKGVIALHDIKSVLNEPALAGVIIAGDILREEFPTTAPDVTLGEALAQFARHEGERLPVVAQNGGRKLIGSISKRDLILALAERGPTAAKE